jgi:hypothetical protein
MSSFANTSVFTGADKLICFLQRVARPDVAATLALSLLPLDVPFTIRQTAQPLVSPVIHSSITLPLKVSTISFLLVLILTFIIILNVLHRLMSLLSILHGRRSFNFLLFSLLFLSGTSLSFNLAQPTVDSNNLELLNSTCRPSFGKLVFIYSSTQCRELFYLCGRTNITTFSR